jgi:hypothetical protein
MKVYKNSESQAWNKIRLESCSLCNKLNFQMYCLRHTNVDDVIRARKRVTIAVMLSYATLVSKVIVTL